MRRQRIDCDRRHWGRDSSRLTTSHFRSLLYGGEITTLDGKTCRPRTGDHKKHHFLARRIHIRIEFSREGHERVRKSSARSDEHGCPGHGNGGRLISAVPSSACRRMKAIWLPANVERFIVYPRLALNAAKREFSQSGWTIEWERFGWLGSD